MKELTEAISRGLGGSLTMGEMNARMEELPDAIKQADRSGWAEGFDGVRRRLISFFRQTAEETSAQGGGNILVVSHAFSIKTVLYLLAPSGSVRWKKYKTPVSPPFFGGRAYLRCRR